MTFFELTANLTPHWVTILSAFIAIAITFSLVTFFVYFPVKKAISERQNLIKTNIDDSIEKNKKADLRVEEEEKNLKEALNEKVQIIGSANEEAEAIKAKALEDAAEEINKIKENLEKISKQEMTKFEKEYTNKVIETALEISKKVLEEQFENKEIKEDELLDSIQKHLN